jgi:hypothetical protein
LRERISSPRSTSRIRPRSAAGWLLGAAWGAVERVVFASAVAEEGAVEEVVVVVVVGW